MIRNELWRPARPLCGFLCAALAWSLVTTPAAADVGWTIDTSHSSLTVVPSLDFPVVGVLNDPDMGFTPEVTVAGVPQTDPGTSGDPLLANPVNSLTTSLNGSFQTLGASFLTSINLGGFAKTPSQLTITANNNGNWLPGVTGGTRDDLNVNYGAAAPAEIAATLERTAPISNFIVSINSVFIDLTTDVG